MAVGGVTVGFLEEILPEIDRSIHQPEYLEGLPSQPKQRPASLRTAIGQRTKPMAMLVEYKRVSPGHEDLRLPARSTADFVRMAERGGAIGLSCLACAPRFDGSPQQVYELTRQTRLPVLFKDFVIDPIQISAASRSGAAAVLLIARLETENRSPVPLVQLARRAHELGLEVVLEYHTPTEVDQVRNVSADVYAVNMRDLNTLRLEPEVAAKAIAAARSRRPLLGLSGVEGPSEVERFRLLGTDGFLVGTAAARAANPIAFLTRLAGVAE